MKAYVGKIDERKHKANIIFCDSCYKFNISTAFKDRTLGEAIHKQLDIVASTGINNTKPFITIKYLGGMYVFCRGIDFKDDVLPFDVRVELSNTLKFALYDLLGLGIFDIGLSLPINSVSWASDIRYFNAELAKYIITRKLNSNIIKLGGFDFTLYIEDNEDTKELLTFLRELHYIEFETSKKDNKSIEGSKQEYKDISTINIDNKVFNKEEALAHIVKQYNLTLLSDTEIKEKLETMVPHAKSYIQKCITNGTIKMCSREGAIFFVGEPVHAFAVQAMLNDADKDYLIWSAKEGHKIFLKRRDYIRSYMSEYEGKKVSDSDISDHFAISILNGYLPKHITCTIKGYGDVALLDLNKEDIKGLFSLCGLYTWSLPHIDGCRDFEVNINEGYSGFITKTEFDDDNLWVVNESLLLRELAKYVFSGEIPDFVYMEEGEELIDLDETTLIELEKYIIATQKR